MKKLLLLLFICVITVSCSVQKINSENCYYAEDVTFKIFKVRKSTFIQSEFSGTTFVTDNTRFLWLTLNVTNSSNEESEINFKEIILLDNENNEYHPQMVTGRGREHQLTYTLPDNKTRKFIIFFAETFPADQEVTRLKINGKVVYVMPAENIK